MLQIILIKYFKKKLINQHKILFHLTKPIVITNKRMNKKMSHIMSHRISHIMNKKINKKMNNRIFKV